jgi:glyoxylase-like metal-dependent hydrolase (beta-lactamase superfamily II)
MADTYGKILPVPEQNLFFHNLVPIPNLQIEVFETPGHASHHLSFKIDDLLFAGEAFGVTIPEKTNTYLRLATPPVFIYNIYKESIELLKMIDDCQVCFGHYNLKSNSKKIAKSALNQLEVWMEISEKIITNEYSTKNEHIIQALIDQDPSLQVFTNLPLDIQQRELEFISNSVVGIKGYLKRKSKENAMTLA